MEDAGDKSVCVCVGDVLVCSTVYMAFCARRVAVREPVRGSLFH